MATLMREPFVVREKGSDTWKSMEEGFGEHASAIRVAMEIPSTETIKQAVIAGMGISFLSAHTISKELKAKSLRLLHVQGFPLMLNWYVVHRRHKRLPPVAQAFKDFLLSDGASLISQIVPFDPRSRRSGARRPPCRRGMSDGGQHRQAPHHHAPVGRSRPRRAAGPRRSRYADAIADRQAPALGVVAAPSAGRSGGEHQVDADQLHRGGHDQRKEEIETHPRGDRGGLAARAGRPA